MDLSPGRILIALRFLVIDLTFALEAFSLGPASQLETICRLFDVLLASLK